MPTVQTAGAHADKHLGQRLQHATEEIEGMLHRLGDGVDDQSELIRSKAQNALNSLRDIERGATSRLESSGRLVQQFVHEKPWTAIAIASAAAFALGALARLRA
jgi:ElaB/YqjD/DUF883 family membrane-anchored ribosome-binding protein